LSIPVVIELGRDRVDEEGRELRHYYGASVEAG
jgi:hypothetical protein